MNWTSNILFKAWILVFIAGISSCEKCTKKPERINLICLIDYSGSLTTETLTFYSKVVSNSIYFNLHHNDRIIVMPIDEAAKTMAIKIYEDDFRTNKSFLRKNDPITHQQDSIKKRMDKYRITRSDSLYRTILIQKEIRKEYTHETDIVSAIQQAKALEESSSTDPKYHITNVIVLLSDMLHESGDFNLRTTDPSKPEQFNLYLENLKKAGHIPDLTEWKIYVNGRTGANNSQVDAVKQFWEKFFFEAHATLCRYDYDCSTEIVAALKAIK